MNFQKLLLQSLVWRGVYFISMLLVNVFLSRYLQAASTGLVYYLSNIFSFSLLIAGFSLESGITFYASGNIISKNRLIYFIAAWGVVVVILVMASVYAYLKFFNGAGEEFADRYYYYGATYIAGLFLTNCAAALFYTQNNFALPNAILAFWNILLVIIIPKHPSEGGILESRPILDTYFLVFVLQGISLTLAYFIRARAFTQLVFPRKTEIRSLFRYSGVALLANIVAFLVYRIDYLFVKISPVCTTSDLGNYIQVSKLGQLLMIIPQILASVIFPRTASGIDRKELNDSIMIIARLFLRLYIIIIVIALIAGRFVFTWLFGETFNEMALPFVILIPGIFSLSVQTLLAAYFSGKGKVIVNFTGTFIALFVVVAGDYFFVPVYGIIAAAAVSTVGYTVNLFYLLYIFYKDYSVNLYEFFYWRKADFTWIKNILLKR